ncbi:hypothetical protein D9M69_706190 [compost metagenome]
MFVFVAGPVRHQRKRPREVAAQKVANRKLRRAEPGEVLERLHGEVEFIRAIGRDILRKDHADESAVQPGRQ